jgi:hypothetical protein
MSKRHENAIGIQKGACNPSGIANAILDACREAREEGMNASECPAVRLMVHQLAFITGARRLDDDHVLWQHAITVCEEKSGVKL